MSQIKTILEEIGYAPKDFGDHYRCRALYRDGGNESALLVKKESGVFIDYGGDNTYLPLKVLVERTIGQDATKRYFSEKGIKLDLPPPPKKVSCSIMQEKSYDQECLKRLLPSPAFYEKKNITSETQKFYKCGLATQKDFYKRIVFPIIRQDQRIHGFSGRAIDSNNSANWLHKGKKQNWIYPYFLEKNGVFEVQEAISDTKELLLVESIGDSMALYQNGFKNNLVTFGLSISPTLATKIVTMELDTVIIAFNDDSDKGTKGNSGQVGLIKAFLRNFNVFGFEKTYWIKPTANDFGDMSDVQFSDFKDNYKALDHQKCVKELLEMCDQYFDFTEMSLAYTKSLKSLREHYQFTYE